MDSMFGDVERAGIGGGGGVAAVAVAGAAVGGGAAGVPPEHAASGTSPRATINPCARLSNREPRTASRARLCELPITTPP